MHGSVRRAVLVVTLVLLSVSFAAANVCDPFVTYVCAAGNPNRMSVAGSGSTGSSVGNLITGNSFTVNITGPGSGPNVESGKLVLFLASTTSFSATITISGSTYAVNTLSAFPTGNSATRPVNTTLSG